MRCQAFRRWLDQGEPALAAGEARVHAAGCPACAALLHAEERLERLLAEPLAPAPAGFTDRLMARLPARRAGLPLLFPETPWWLRAISDPAAVLALILAGLLSWRGGALWGAALVLGTQSGAWVARGMSSAAAAVRLGLPLEALSGPGIELGLEIALASGLLLAAPALTRWGLRSASRAVARA